MTDLGDLDAVARGIIEADPYMTLGTADGSGRPWVTPVYFACEGYTDFYWVSSPESRHSRNISARPEVAIVVFDTHSPIGEGQAVYVAATAAEATGETLDRGIRVYSERSVGHGVRAWTVDDVIAPQPYRMYRATASDHWVVDPDAHPNRRVRVTPRHR